LLRDKILEF